MKKSLKNITRFFIIALTLANPQLSHAMEQELPNQRPHVMLHVDINRTLIVEDIGKGLGPDECLAAILSAAPEYSHTWDNNLEKSTYKKWVDEKLFPGSYQDPVLKKKRENAHTKFIDVARDNNHPMFNEIDDKFKTLLDILEAQGSGKVFKSFPNLITYLKDRKYSFSVILRTFGDDLSWVSQELEKYGLNFIHGSFHEGVLHLNDSVFKEPVKMISAFERGKHYAIQDSHGWWEQHNQKEKGGKPFPIDIADKNVLSIFFDDNANSSKRQILNVIPFGEKTNLNDLIKMGRVVAVDPLKAIMEENYFIDAFETALKKF